jgi:hypothetical protein
VVRATTNERTETKRIVGLASVLRHESASFRQGVAISQERGSPAGR